MNSNFEHILIGGLQRSGTSLVRAIVGSHSRISIFQLDLEFWTKFYRIYGRRPLTLKEKQRLIRDVIKHPKHQNTDIRFSESDFTDSLDFSSKDFFFDFYESFLSKYSQRTKGDLVGLKTPENEFLSKMLLEKYPKLKFIQVLRNPLDAAVSLTKIKKDSWGGSVNYFAHIRKWKESISIAESNLQAFPDRYLLVKYEDLLNDPQVEVKRICTFLEIEFENEMLEMKGHPGWTGSNSSFGAENSSDGINLNAMKRFQENLPTKAQNYYFYFLKNELAKYYSYNTEMNVNVWAKFQYLISTFLAQVSRWVLYRVFNSKLYYPLKDLRG